MNDEKPSYDKLACPGIGQLSRCKPEIREFTVSDGEDEYRYRIVLTGKRGLPGWKEDPVVHVERMIGVDALGVVAWAPYDGEPTTTRMLVALFMACRKAAQP